MCGIAGYWTPRSVDKTNEAISAMLDTIVHRGPDSHGVWRDSRGSVVLGQRRLAIIDLSPGGHQPMLSDDSKTVITFNGEIYNYLELRQELESKGIRFRSQSDTEVLLKGYEVWGVNVLDKLVGMFAFALWDEKKQQLFCARDRAGEKPFYYTQGERGFAFASEIQALTILPWVDSTLDREAVALYLNHGYIPAPHSIYKGIRKLPPAHAMTIDAKGMKTWRYWDPVKIVSQGVIQISEEEALSQLETLLRRAVTQQMIADVPLGAFLSGGIDSSTVVSMMQEISGSRPVKTFTIGFAEAPFNEADHAKAVADFLGTEHTCEYLTQQDSLNLIPQLPGMYGEPFADASALPTYLVSRVARKHVTVSLSGDGGDEAFGGYTRHGALEGYAPFLKAMSPFAPVLAPLTKMLPGKAGKVGPYLGKPLQVFYRSAFGTFKDHEVRLLTGLQPYNFEFERAWNEPKLSVRRHAMLTDMLSYMPEDVLVKVDRAAMAVSLETRAPLLDHRILEWSLRLPENLIQDKRILKQLAFKRMPRNLLERPKQGFGVPLADWFRKDLRNLLVDSLQGSRLKALGLENTAFVDTLVREHLSGTQNNAARLWPLLALSLWQDEQRSKTAQSKIRAS
jgi:asparagine synthase (glutamine-hydrolysing)